MKKQHKKYIPIASIFAVIISSVSMINWQLVKKEADRASEFAECVEKIGDKENDKMI